MTGSWSIGVDVMVGTVAMADGLETARRQQCNTASAILIWKRCCANAAPDLVSRVWGV